MTRTISADDLETLARAAHADIELPGPEGGWAVAVINGRVYRARVAPVEHIDLAVDSEGHRYTTHAFARHGDPWHGATILTPAVVADLRARGELPLTEATR